MKFKLNHRQKRLPFGGHHFIENGVTIKGETAQEVADLLENFRLINGKPIGDPLDEIITYYARKFPWMVEYDFNPEEKDPLSAEYINWRDWISSHWGKPPGKYLSRKEASMRWEICKKCPHNVGKPWKHSKESEEFSRKAMMMRRGEAVEEDFCYCDLHRADISVSSFIERPNDLSRKAKDEQDQEGCWFSISEGP